MTNISQKELMSLSDIVGRHQNIASKLSDYAEECTDPEIKQMFNQASKEASQSVQNLINML